MTPGAAAVDTARAFVFRLIPSRPTFALDLSEDEQEIMGRHAAHWQPLIESGQMAVFGPMLDETGSWGLGLVETHDEAELRALAASDPAVAAGVAEIELGSMLGGFVRGRGRRTAGVE
jgi:uncharacterized protein YciI